MKKVKEHQPEQIIEILEPETIIRADYGSPERPLRIADYEIPCYVLENEKRVIVLSGLLSALDMSQGTAGRGTGNRLSKFLRGKSIRPFIPQQVLDQVDHPIKFRTTSGSLAYGFEATLLADICDAILEAKQKTKLNYQLEHIVKRAEILVRGYARVGVVALVDEATGFQSARTRDALEIILQQFISDELMKWVKTFPDEFYMQLFRLRGWPYTNATTKRSGLIGHLTNDIVYKRLAPKVLEDLQRITPRDDKGRRKHKFFQRLTEDIGHPRLREHLASVITLMRVSSNYKQFEAMLNKALPRYDDTLQLALEA